MPRTILCLDDEVNVLKALARIFRKEGYTLYTTTDPEQALSIIEEEPIQLIICDQRMPKLTGTEFFRNVKTHYPQPVRVLLSGYAEISAVVDAINQGGVYRFLTKPWQDEQLRREIQSCFDHYDQLLAQVQHEGELRYISEQLRRALIVNDTLGRQWHQMLSERVSEPLMAIEKNGQILMANTAMRCHFNLHDEYQLMEKAYYVLPEALSAGIRSFQNTPSYTARPLIINDAKGETQIYWLQPLYHGEAYIGVLLSLQGGTTL